MNYWLMKSEPDVFGIDHLKKMPKKTEHWDGVRNYQARNMLRDQMKKGDLVFWEFYGDPDSWEFLEYRRDAQGGEYNYGSGKESPGVAGALYAMRLNGTVG